MIEKIVYENIDLQKLKLEINRQIKHQGGKKIKEVYTQAQIENKK